MVVPVVYVVPSSGASRLAAGHRGPSGVPGPEYSLQSPSRLVPPGHPAGALGQEQVTQSLPGRSSVPWFLLDVRLRV